MLVALVMVVGLVVNKNMAGVGIGAGISTNISFKINLWNFFHSVWVVLLLKIHGETIHTIGYPQSKKIPVFRYWLIQLISFTLNEKIATPPAI
jgi:hypothetical protein